MIFASLKVSFPATPTGMWCWVNVGAGLSICHACQCCFVSVFLHRLMLVWELSEAEILLFFCTVGFEIITSSCVLASDVLKLHVALVLGFCLQVNYIHWDLSMGQGFMLWRWGKGNDLENSCALHLTLPTHFVLSVQQFPRPMLRTRIGNWSGFMKKKVAKEWSCVFTAGPLSKVSDPCTIKGVHCSKWMRTSSSTGLSVGTSMADLLKHCLEVMLWRLVFLPVSLSHH